MSALVLLLALWLCWLVWRALVGHRVKITQQTDLSALEVVTSIKVFEGKLHRCSPKCSAYGVVATPSRANADDEDTLEFWYSHCGPADTLGGRERS